MAENHNDHSTQLEPPIGSADAAVVLPCSTDQFAAFVKTLLGQPQSIARRIKCRFELDKTHFMNFHHLIEQRVEQQNESRLIQFSAEIFFDDGLSRKVNSVEAFDAFYEIRPVRSVALRLMWTMLVQFPSKDYPEKQEISMFFNTRRDTFYDELDEIDFFGEIFFTTRYSGSIGYVIDHTQRTWGDDIQNMLENHVNSIIKKENSFKIFFQRHCGKIITLFGLSALVGGLTILKYITGQIRDGKLEEYKTIITNADSSLLILNVKIDYLFNAVLWGKFGRSPEVGAIIVVFISIFSSLLIAYLFRGIFQPSFILLTDKTRDARDQSENKTRGKWIGIISTFMLSVLERFRVRLNRKWIP